MSNFKMFETRRYGEPVSTYSDLERKDVVNILDARADLTVEEKQTVLTFLDTASYGEFCQVQGWYILCLKQDEPRCELCGSEGEDPHCAHCDDYVREQEDREYEEYNEGRAKYG